MACSIVVKHPKAKLLPIDEVDAMEAEAERPRERRLERGHHHPHHRGKRPLRTRMCDAAHFGLHTSLSSWRSEDQNFAPHNIGSNSVSVPLPSTTAEVQDTVQCGKNCIFICSSYDLLQCVYKNFKGTKIMVSHSFDFYEIN